MVASFVDKLVMDIGGPLGFGLTVLLLLGWCVAYPSLLALPLLVWAIYQLVLYYHGTAEERKPLAALNYLLILGFAIMLVRTRGCMQALWPRTAVCGSSCDVMCCAFAASGRVRGVLVLCVESSRRVLEGRQPVFV